VNCDALGAIAELVGAIGVICDPETVEQARQAGVGQTIQVRLGGKSDDRHGDPVEGDAYVQSLCDGDFVYRGSMMQGVADTLGPTATIVVGGVEVVVTSLRRQCWDAEILRIAGVEPTEKRLLVLKSAVHFRADFGPLAAGPPKMSVTRPIAAIGLDL